MATFVEHGAQELEESPPPDWSPVAEPERRPRVAAAWRAAAGLAIVAFLWWRGRHTLALVLLGVLVVATAASLFVPAVAAAFDRVARAVERGAGVVLSVLVLGLLELLVIIPAWLGLRALRRDPLALGVRPDAPSLWRPAPAQGRRPLYRRQFTYERPEHERPATAVDRLPLPRVRAVLGIVALLVIADIAVGAVLHAFDHTGEARPAGARQSLLLNPTAPASRGQPWLSSLAAEIDQVWYGKRYDPFLGWRLPDHHGRYLNVAAGVRRSWEPPTSTTARRPLAVYFFGGSTMFGLFQRDEHTIPSEIAQLAAADGIPIRVVNYGQMAYNNWQELQLLEQLGPRIRPDLTVFYDGVNELVSQFRVGPHTDPSQQEAGEYAKRIGLGAASQTSGRQGNSSPLTQLYRSWQDVSALNWFSRRVRGAPTETPPKTQPLVSPWAGNQQQEAVAAGRDAAALLAQGMDVERRLAQSSSYRSAFFLQPFLYSKPAMTGDAPAVGSLGTDPGAWRRAYSTLRSDLGPGVVDLSGALDSVRQPIFYDFAHTNEPGARVVAQALYARLKPTLRELSRRANG